MQRSINRFVAVLRRPQYTGENRCLPCTVLNTIIAVVLSAILAVALSTILAVTTSWLVGVATLIACLGAIYFRGYLVPGTPTVTKRYLPERIHRLFGTHHGEVEDSPDHVGSPDTTADLDDADPETLLRATGLVEDCSDDDDLCLDSGFREGWRQRMRSLETDEARIEKLAERLGIEADRLELDGGENAFAVTYDGDHIATWPSEAAFHADLAAAPELDERAPAWRNFEEYQQGTVLAALRVFLEECPVCGGDIDGNEKTIETCCSTRTRESLECVNCGKQLFSQIA